MTDDSTPLYRQNVVVSQKVWLVAAILAFLVLIQIDYLVIKTKPLSIVDHAVRSFAEMRSDPSIETSLVRWGMACLIGLYWLAFALLWFSAPALIIGWTIAAITAIIGTVARSVHTHRRQKHDPANSDGP